MLELDIDFFSDQLRELPGVLLPDSLLRTEIPDDFKTGLGVKGFIQMQSLEWKFFTGDVDSCAHGIQIGKHNNGIFLCYRKNKLLIFFSE
ncbi:hypothetical protein HQ47_04230 [Porphyromonas macacae]|uniref:Uncharacterized protein n=1 Tax=Porphyromonas macacae TaxID=28115 RepID=A0A0A2EBR9_9PORP|nr:hypothetical protein [Porphyromonas macacae]KGN75112.1 hypothetical protein HQ47_04230 [Porphyromonas macacae]